MIYQQQTAVADAPAMRETMADAPGLSSSFFCAAAAATVAAVVAAGAASAETAAASSGSCCFCAAAAATAAGADAAADSANSCSKRGVGASTPAPLFLCSLRFIFLYLSAFCTLQIDLINRRLIDDNLCPLFLGHALHLFHSAYYPFYENTGHSLSYFFYAVGLS